MTSLAGDKRVVRVSRSQVLAARALLELADKGVGEATPALRAIAAAKPASKTG